MCGCQPLALTALVEGALVVCNTRREGLFHVADYCNLRTLRC